MHSAGKIAEKYMFIISFWVSTCLISEGAHPRNFIIYIYIHTPKMMTCAIGKCTSFQIWPLWVSMFNFRGSKFNKKSSGEVRQYFSQFAETCWELS